MAPKIVTVKYSILKNTYPSFITELRKKLADHPSPEDVEGRPVLAKQLAPKEPARWIYVELEGKNNAKPTLAIRDDNVYLIGFKNKDGKWYEFGTKGKTVPILPQSTLLGFEGDYQSLIGRIDNLVKVKLGKFLATDAVDVLWKHPAKETITADDVDGFDINLKAITLKEALARLIVMINEAARMTSIYDTVNANWEAQGGSSINNRQVDYVKSWGDMSESLLGWKLYKDKYKWPDKLKKIGINNKDEALKVVYLVLNKRPPPPKSTLLEVSDGRTARHLHGATSTYGRPLVEVFTVRAGFCIVGTIAVFDGMRGQIIYNRDGSGGDSLPIHGSQDTIMLTGPHRAISAYGNFAIEVDLKDGGELSAEDEASKGTLCWDCYDTNAEYDKPLSQTINTRHGPVEVTYAVLSNAVEANVQVKLVGDQDGEAPTNVYGKVIAHSKAFDLGSVLFSNDTDDNVVVSSEQLIPLARSIVAAPANSPLIIEANLYTSSNQKIVQGTLEFYPELSGEHVKYIFGENGNIEVKITWSDFW